VLTGRDEMGGIDLILVRLERLVDVGCGGCRIHLYLGCRIALPCIYIYMYIYIYTYIYIYAVLSSFITL
jgi:hypothetical protein